MGDYTYVVIDGTPVYVAEGSDIIDDLYELKYLLEGGEDADCRAAARALNYIKRYKARKASIIRLIRKADKVLAEKCLDELLPG